MGSSDIVLLLQQLFGGADDRRFVAVRSANVLDRRSNDGVGQVLTIPGQKIFRAVDYRYADVERVLHCLLREEDLAQLAQRRGPAHPRTLPNSPGAQAPSVLRRPLRNPRRLLPAKRAVTQQDDSARVASPVQSCVIRWWPATTISRLGRDVR